VVDREAVLQAVRPAGVLREVAADRADLLAGGVGRVVVARADHRLRHLQVRHPGLDDDAFGLEVDPKDPGHPRETDHDALGNGEGPAREPGAGTAGDERDAGRVARPHDRLDLLRRLRQHDERRHDATAGQTVALVGAELLRLRDDRALRHAGPDLVDEADAFGVTTSPRTKADSFAVAFVLGFVSHRAHATARRR
jgi:hypothetical protein